MPYGSIKVDNIVFTNGGSDQTITVSGLIASTSGNLTVTGTVQGETIIGTSTISGATITGNTGQFTTLTGGTAGFTTVTGTTVTGTTANFASGVFTTQISGATVTGNVGSFATITGGVVTLTSGVFAAGSASAPSISFSSDSNTGIYSPGADQVAISTAGSGRLFVDASGVVQQGFNQTPNGLTALGFIASTNSGAGNNFIGYKAVDAVGNSSSISLARSRGTVSAPTALQTGDSVMSVNGFAYDGSSCRAIAVMGAAIDSISGVDDVAGYLTFQTRSSGLGAPLQERLRITSAGLVGVGDSAPDGIVHARQDVTSGNYQARLYVQNTDQKTFIGSYWRTGVGQYSVIQSTNDAESVPGVLLLNPSGGNVAIGTTTAEAALHVNGTIYSKTATNPTVGIWNTTSSFSTFLIQEAAEFKLYTGAGQPISFATNGLERARLTASGQLLVGTSSARSNYSAYGASLAQIEGANNDGARALSVTYGKADAGDPIIALGKHRSNSVGGTTVVVDGDGLGQVVFSGSDGTNFVTAATIGAQVDGTPGSTVMPGRLIFSTTSTTPGASPTERMRIKANGATCIGTSTEGTMSGDTVVAIGPNIGIISKSASGIAASGTVDININTGGGGYQGFLVVSNTDASNGSVRTHTTFSVFGRGTDSSIQQIATDNGTTSGASFTVTTPTNGVIRVTNTSAGSRTVHIQFFGGTSF